MTTYHETLNISCWDAIKSKFQHYIDIAIEEPNPNITLVITSEEQQWLDTNLAPEVSSILGIEIHVILGLVTLIPSMNEAVIHIDGNVIPRVPSDPNWALNIPLYNYLELEETWYGGDYNIFINQSREGLKWIDMNFNGERELRASKLINEPTLIRIDSPHRISNHSEKNSAILSVRFTPDLKPKDY
jgi:hypothetical protein